MVYGRPNQILADNGTQFKNLIGELGTKYTRLLEILDIKLKNLNAFIEKSSQQDNSFSYIFITKCLY
ncbi:hypothetical protein LCGC14_1276120 [marine sediment metagenome]|uniref:Uncharacterized protein n=1 Tax=marine sediment metagenome TaxID=412755 RepID=A0A0F9NZN2_9ZZZZ